MQQKLSHKAWLYWRYKSVDVIHSVVEARVISQVARHMARHDSQLALSSQPWLHDQLLDLSWDNVIGGNYRIIYNTDYLLDLLRIEKWLRASL